MLNDARTLLVVDDDADFRSALSDALADEGYRLRFAADGDEALRLLCAGAPLPAAILLDLAMPNMTGWQFRDLQKRRPELAGIPVLVMTGSNPLGIDAVKILRKPFRFDELVDWVRRIAS
jgi:CheY-like chemotaxis protein